MVLVKDDEVKGKIRRDDPVPIEDEVSGGRHEAGKWRRSMEGVRRHGHGHS